MLTREQQRDIMAAGLLALALFCLAALIPVTVFGPRLAGLFPSGNVMGLVGAATKGGLSGLLGSSAFFVPVLLLLSGLRAGQWLSAGWTVRLMILTAGLTLILPVGLQVSGQGVETAGAWGAFAGPPLATALGLFGVVLLLGLLIVVLCVGALGWNPLRSLARGIARAANALASWGGSLRARWGMHRHARLEEIPPMELLGDGGVPEAEGAADKGLKAEAAGSSQDLEAQPDVEHFGRADGGGGADSEAAAHDGVDVGSPHGPPDPLPRGELSQTGLPPVEFMTTVDERDRAHMERALDTLGEVLIGKLRTFGVESELWGSHHGSGGHTVRSNPGAGRQG